MSTLVPGNDLSRFFIIGAARLGARFRGALANRAERRRRNRAARLLNEVDIRVLRDIGYDRVNGTVIRHAAH